MVPPCASAWSIRGDSAFCIRAVKPAAFTQHPRPAYYDRTPEGVPEAMGYSVRTDKVRYTEWRDWKTGKVIARELYEHARDPGEMRNTVDSPGDAEALKDAVKVLNEQVPPDVLPQLGQPFFRPDEARTRAEGGVGLGLSLCRLVAQAHGSALVLRNADPGLEASVTFSGR